VRDSDGKARPRRGGQLLAAPADEILGPAGAARRHARGDLRRGTAPGRPPRSRPGLHAAGDGAGVRRVGGLAGGGRRRRAEAGRLHARAAGAARRARRRSAGEAVEGAEIAVREQLERRAPGATVQDLARRVLRRHRATARSAVDGTFRVGGLPAGTYELSAAKEGFGHRPQTVQAPDEEVELRLIAAGGVRGEVLDERGAPAAGAAVELSAARSRRGGDLPAAASTRRSARADADGRFRFADLTDGSWLVEAVPQDSRLREPAAYAAATVEVQSGSEAELRLVSRPRCPSPGSWWTAPAAPSAARTSAPGARTGTGRARCACPPSGPRRPPRTAPSSCAACRRGATGSPRARSCSRAARPTACRPGPGTCGWSWPPWRRCAAGWSTPRGGR
jgi:hypothetical protein